MRHGLIKAMCNISGNYTFTVIGFCGDTLTIRGSALGVKTLLGYCESCDFTDAYNKGYGYVYRS